jgi:hypothetical protein
VLNTSVSSVISITHKLKCSRGQHIIFNVYKMMYQQTWSYYPRFNSVNIFEPLKYVPCFVPEAEVRFPYNTKLKHIVRLASITIKFILSLVKIGL